jgi:HAE1 family hydrophobic/amphiphilic exporter-1
MYATPDGHLVPAYLLEERVDKDWNHIKSAEDKNQLQTPEASSYSRDDMAAMLEELLKIVKEDNKEKKEHNKDENT